MRRQRGVAVSVILAAIAAVMLILSFFAGRSSGGNDKTFPIPVFELFLILIILLVVTVIFKNIKSIIGGKNDK